MTAVPLLAPMELYTIARWPSATTLAVQEDNVYYKTLQYTPCKTVSTQNR